MSTLLDEPVARAAVTAGPQLRATTAAVRVSLRWLGTRKTLTPEQKAQAAESFGAAGQFLSAGKKLLDTSHPAFRAVTSVRNRLLGCWKGMTLPYPEPGIRLIRQDEVNVFDVRMDGFRAELQQTVSRLDDHYAELKLAARQRLGSLYQAADYPESLQGWFGVDWDFPAVEPPSYLRQLSPELYRQEQARVSARFDEAIRLAEEAFTTELGQLVSHLCERLSGRTDGKPKVFRDTAIGNLLEFFDRFRQLNVGASDQLDALVDQAREIVQGIEPQQLRDNHSLRQHVAHELTEVRTAVDELLVDRPRRNILRRATAHTASAPQSQRVLVV